MFTSLSNPATVVHIMPFRTLRRYIIVEDVYIARIYVIERGTSTEYIWYFWKNEPLSFRVSNSEPLVCIYYYTNYPATILVYTVKQGKVTQGVKMEEEKNSVYNRLMAESQRKGWGCFLAVFRQFLHGLQGDVVCGAQILGKTRCTHPPGNTKLVTGNAAG